MSFYRACMRCSSVILFWVAVVIFVVGLLTPILLDAGSPQDPYSSGGTLSVRGFISAIYSGVSGAIMPFFAAALLYLLDTRLPAKEAAK